MYKNKEDSVEGANGNLRSARMWEESERVATLSEGFFRAAATDQTITYVAGSASQTVIRYGDLYKQALRLLRAFQLRGLGPGSELVICVKDNAEFITAFWACILGRIVPVPLASGALLQHRYKILNVFSQLADAHVYVHSSMLDRLLELATESGRYDKSRLAQRAIAMDKLVVPDEAGEIWQAAPDDTAFIQFSSGSTSSPKGIVLTHANVVSNLYAIAAAADYLHGEVVLSWMPLSHDMGLIGAHIGVLVCGLSLVLIPTELFIRRPTIWMDQAQRSRANILVSPNFGYRHFLDAYRKRRPVISDLRSVRAIFNGAEPISVEICEEFLDAMEPFGLKRPVMYPVYGLAEASLAVTFSPYGKPYRTVYVQRKFLGKGDRVRFSDSAGPETVAIPVTGGPVAECAVRICCGDEPQPEGVVGSIQIKGTNVTRGYYRAPDLTAETITSDGWLDTGDLGFLQDGELIITGRAKEMILQNGQNFYPHDIESVLVRKGLCELGRVAVCGVRVAEPEDEQIVVFCADRRSRGDFDVLAAQIRRCLAKEMGIIVASVLRMSQLPKTTSGKVQRTALADRYLAGEWTDGICADAVGVVKSYEHSRGNLLEIETSLRRLCEESAGTDIGIHDDIFDLGLDSLKIAELVEKANVRFPGSLHIVDLYDYPTIAQIAALIAKRQSGESELTISEIVVEN